MLPLTPLFVIFRAEHPHGPIKLSCEVSIHIDEPAPLPRCTVDHKLDAHTSLSGRPPELHVETPNIVADPHFGDLCSDGPDC